MKSPSLLNHSEPDFIQDMIDKSELEAASLAGAKGDIGHARSLLISEELKEELFKSPFS